MCDTALAKEILQQMRNAAQTIARRFATISCPEDFLRSEMGCERLDAICMQLIALGESVKQLDKVTRGMLLCRYPQVEWKRIMGMRDVLSHHYFDLDAEVVYTTCADHIPMLLRTIETMLTELEEG